MSACSGVCWPSPFSWSQHPHVQLTWSCTLHTSTPSPIRQLSATLACGAAAAACGCALQVWNREDPCFVCGFDMDPLGAAQALASQPEGTAICCFSLEHPNSLVLICKQKAPDASTGEDGLLQAVVQADDLMERRVETWLRDLQAATHLLDVYRNKRVDKRVLLGLNKFTRLRAMDRLDAYDDILI